jgi:FixJ family two-component response regulator
VCLCTFVFADQASDVPPHSWRDLLTEITGLSKTPFLIVTSPQADDRLWAEALNLGAYDVLPKPFDEAEVRRSVGIAVLHWQWIQESALPPLVRASGPRPVSRL